MFNKLPATRVWNRPSSSARPAFSPAFSTVHRSVSRDARVIL